MEKKPNMDAFGAVSLVMVALVLAFAQVVIKVTNEGLQPVYGAALRSIGAALCVGLWVWWRGFGFSFSRKTLPTAMLMGAFFGIEFIFLFVGLDLTTVARSAVLMNSMPVWLAIGAHFLVAGEAMNPRKATGLTFAFFGVVVALAGRGDGTGGSLAGDLCSLMAAIAWAAIALCAKTPALSQVRAEALLFYQTAFSIPILVIATPFFGPLVRDLQPIHIYGLVFQTVVVVSGIYMVWLWLLRIYPAASVASFSFLAPVFGVFLGWLLLDEPVGPETGGALLLVALGLWLINRPSSAAKRT